MSPQFSLFRQTLVPVLTAAAVAAAVGTSWAGAQSMSAVPVAATATTVVPSLVRYAGVVAGRDAKPVSATFLVFKDETGGVPLWSEAQTVTPDAAGHFEVYLGAANVSGLPVELFGTGEARWVEVQMAGLSQQPRVLLASVPYAMKAADAATLGGLPASAFALAGAGSVSTAATNAAVPETTGSTVTTTGGTAGYLPVYSGATTVDDSVVFESGTRIGIGTKAPAATLDIEGAIIGRGLLTLEATGTATATAGKDSQALELMASAYSSSLKKAETEAFSLQAEPASSNTSTPAATLNFLYGASGAAPTETGLSISSKGIVKFATGQTFPGSGGSGTITGVTAGSYLTGGGTTGAVTLSLDTSKVPTLTGNPVFTGTVTANNSQYSTTTKTASAIHGNETGSNGVGVFGTAAGDSGIGVYGEATGDGFVGVFGTTSTAGGGGVEGLYQGENIGFGVIGNTSDGGAGVLGVSERDSQTYGALTDYFSAGVWGDTSATTGYGIGVIGSADQAPAGFFTNSGPHPTLYISGTATTGLDNQPPDLLYAQGLASNGGLCTIDVYGDLYCGGVVSGSEAIENGTRTVETYAMHSAENWYEDAGTGQLAGGATRVALEVTFGQTVNTGVEYHVFLTPKGDCKGLYVTNETSTGFEVHELGGGTSSIAFDYRIMAKRVGHENERLVDITERLKKHAAMQARLKRPTDAANAAALQRGVLGTLSGKPIRR